MAAEEGHSLATYSTAESSSIEVLVVTVPQFFVS